MDELEHEQPSPQPREPGSAGKEGLDTEAQIMGRLPRTRPQRRSDRRPAGANESGPAAKRAAAPRRTQRTGTASRGRTAASSAARSRSSGRQPSRKQPTATRVAARKRAAPGIPRLALDVAVEAAKLPLKVTATVARQATRLVGRGLRLR